MLATWLCLLLTACSALAAPAATVLQAAPLAISEDAPLEPASATDNAALGTTLSNIIQTTLTAAADTAEPAMLQAAQAGQEAIITNAPAMQSGFQTTTAGIAAQLPSRATTTAGLAGLAPVLGPSIGPTLASAAPTLGTLASGAVNGLAGLGMAAGPGVGPGLRTTTATLAGAARSAAPSIAPATARVAPGLGGVLGSTLTNAVLPAARQLPTLLGRVTPVLTNMLPMPTSFAANEPHDVHIDAAAPAPSDAPDSELSSQADAPVTAPSGTGAPELAPLMEATFLDAESF